MNRPLMLATVAFASAVCLSPAASQTQPGGKLMQSDRAAVPSAMPPSASTSSGIVRGNNSGTAPTQSGGRGGSRRVAEPASATTTRTQSVANIGQISLALPGIAPAPRGASEPLARGHSAVARAGAASTANVDNRATSRVQSIAAVHNVAIAQPGIAPAANAYGGAQGRLTMGSKAVGRAGASGATVANRATARVQSIAAVHNVAIAQPGIAPAANAVSGAQGRLTMNSKAVGRAGPAAKAQVKLRGVARAQSMVSSSGADTTLPGMGLAK
jgi:hypothetical protein